MAISTIKDWRSWDLNEEHQINRTQGTFHSFIWKLKPHNQRQSPQNTCSFKIIEKNVPCCGSKKVIYHRNKRSKRKTASLKFRKRIMTACACWDADPGLVAGSYLALAPPALALASSSFFPCFSLMISASLAFRCSKVMPESPPVAFFLACNLMWNIFRELESHVSNLHESQWKIDKLSMYLTLVERVLVPQETLARPTSLSKACSFATSS